MHLDVNNTSRIDFDPFRMILTFIYVANAYVIGTVTGMATLPISARLQIRHMPNFWVMKYKKLI